MPDERRLKDMACPQCRKKFTLRRRDSWRNPEPTTLIIRDCPSGGVYDVQIKCPHCYYEEEL